MKKTLLALLLLALPALAQTTPNLGFNIPTFGTPNWNVPVNANFSSLDLLLSGHSSLPALSITGNVTLGSVAGTQCLHAVAGVISGTGSDCGSGSGTVTGSGTTGLMPAWTSSSALGDTDLQFTSGTPLNSYQTNLPSTWAIGSGGFFTSSSALTAPDFLLTYSPRISGSNTSTLQAAEFDVSDSTNTTTPVTQSMTGIKTQVLGSISGTGPTTTMTILEGIKAVVTSPLNAGTTAENGLDLVVNAGNGSTTVAAKHGIDISGSSGAGSGVVTQDAAIYVHSPTSGGTSSYTHHYGIYLEDQTTGSNADPHGVHQLGTSPNEFQGHINQIATGNWAGTCVFAAGTTCSVTYGTAFVGTPVVLITPVNPGSVTFTLTSTSNTGFTVTGSSSNSLTVNWAAFGNPN